MRINFKKISDYCRNVVITLDKLFETVDCAKYFVKKVSKYCNYDQRWVPKYIFKGYK